MNTKQQLLDLIKENNVLQDKHEELIRKAQIEIVQLQAQKTVLQGLLRIMDQFTTD